MTDRKQTLIIDTGGDVWTMAPRNIISHDAIEGKLTDFTANLDQPLIISKTCNIFIDHITLSGGKSSLSSQSELYGVNPGDGVNYHQVRSVTQQRNTFQFIAAGENISLSESSPVRADGNAMSEKLSTLGATDGPMLQLKIIGIGTSTSMEHNPYVNALNSDGLDLQNTFQFTNTNNKIIQ